MWQIWNNLLYILAELRNQLTKYYSNLLIFHLSISLANLLNNCYQYFIYMAYVLPEAHYNWKVLSAVEVIKATVTSAYGVAFGLT